MVHVFNDLHHKNMTGSTSDGEAQIIIEHDMLHGIPGLKLKPRRSVYGRLGLDDFIWLNVDDSWEPYQLQRYKDLRTLLSSDKLFTIELRDGIQGHADRSNRTAWYGLSGGIQKISGNRSPNFPRYEVYHHEKTHLADSVNQSRKDRENYARGAQIRKSDYGH